MKLLKEYQLKAAQTAIYTGRDSVEGLIYCVLKLNGEVSEAKCHQNDNTELKKELGDVLWYVSQISHETKIDIEEIENVKPCISKRNINDSIATSYINMYLDSLSISAGTISESLGKALRDDDALKSNILIEKRLNVFNVELKKIYETILNICEILGIDVCEILEKNIEKLFSRKDRNKLKGSGDNR